MKKLVGVIIAGCCIIWLNGCAAVLVGGGVAGGLAMSKDTVEIAVDKSYGKVWGVCISEISKMGTVVTKDKEAGKIEASIREAKVNVTMVQLTARTVQLKIKARKNLLPNMDIANELSQKILKRL